ncbi:hypothetical protein FB192DRAFT_1020960 [Mucor lusitanicus]|uniref:Uncharacterized protein n=1 Tax=Mucor circinelloides f. lusitanicus TaxID=29924 RepID=A0A8H4BTV3_MUCCL|nr:hypothetical protein FB192DRAFT_1020960 [Mucor lusitanicus]
MRRDKTSISRNYISEFDRDHITWHQFSSFHCTPLTVSLHFAFRSQRVHQCLDSITSLTLLQEANDGVCQQEKDNTNEILPVWRLTTTIGQSNGHQSSSFHDPGQRIPHEAQKLQYGVDFFMIQAIVAKFLDTGGSFIRSQPVSGSSSRRPNQHSFYSIQWQAHDILTEAAQIHLQAPWSIGHTCPCHRAPQRSIAAWEAHRRPVDGEHRHAPRY